MAEEQKIDVWMSFAREGLPGECCIVQVSEADLDAAKFDLLLLHDIAEPTDEQTITAAAIGMAWKMGCNPGGSAMVIPIPTEDRPAYFAAVPRNQLLTQEHISAMNCVRGDIDDPETWRDA